MYVYIFIYMKSGLLLNSDQYYLLIKKQEDNSQKFDTCGPNLIPLAAPARGIQFFRNAEVDVTLADAH